MIHPQGAVVVASDPFGQTPRRPYLICSHEDHPFAGEQYTAVGITTSEYEASVPLGGRLTNGRLDREADSTASPWAVVSLKPGHIEKRIAQVDPGALATVADRLCSYVSPQ